MVLEFPAQTQLGRLCGKELLIALGQRQRWWSLCRAADSRTSIWSLEQHNYIWPTDENPIKQPHHWPIWESMYFRTWAHTSPFFDQRIKLSSVSELNLVSFCWCEWHRGKTFVGTWLRDSITVPLDLDYRWPFIWVWTCYPYEFHLLGP